MNPLAELLSVDDVRLDVDATDKEALLAKIAGMLSRRQNLSQADVLASLGKREELGSTGLGHGVAIPHARMGQCNMASAALVRTRVPIPFDAPDGRPVSVFLGLIVPQRANERHLQLLATAAMMFGERKFRQSILACGDAGCMRDLVAAWRESGNSVSPEQPGV